MKSYTRRKNQLRSKKLKKVLAEIVDRAQILFVKEANEGFFCKNCYKDFEMSDILVTFYWTNSVGRYGVLKQLCVSQTCPFCEKSKEFNLGRGFSVLVHDIKDGGEIVGKSADILIIDDPIEPNDEIIEAMVGKDNEEQKLVLLNIQVNYMVDNRFSDYAVSVAFDINDKNPILHAIDGIIKNFPEEL